MIHFILFTLVSNFSFASSLTTLQGKLISITDQDIAIQRGKTTYYIKRSALTPNDAKNTATVGKDVTIRVPLEAIDATKFEK